MPYQINGQPANISPEPVQQDGATYVPLSPIVQALGGTVTWDNTTKTAAATVSKWTANVQMENRAVNVSGTPVALSAPPYVDNEEMFVPWDFFIAAYGYKGELNGDTVSIHL